MTKVLYCRRFNAGPLQNSHQARVRKVQPAYQGREYKVGKLEPISKSLL
jgi:hypothetical protein